MSESHDLLKLDTRLALRPREAAAHETEGSSGSPEAEGSPFAGRGHRSGNFRAVITSVAIEPETAAGSASHLTPGVHATIVLRAVGLETIDSPTCGSATQDRRGKEC